MARSVILLSGGLDSTVNLGRAINETEVVLVFWLDSKRRQNRQRGCVDDSQALTLGSF